MFDYLVDHARRNVWCAPKMDRQVILKPQRITHERGVRGHARHLWGTIDLPTTQDVYHVFQVGQVTPRLLGLLPVQRTWHTFGYTMAQEDLIAEVYTNDGIMLCRAHCWWVYTDERNLLIAVRDQPSITNLRTEEIYVRLYSNAFFYSERAQNQNHRILHRAHTHRVLNATLDFQQDYLNHMAMPGATWLYVNGRLRRNFLPQSLQVGDLVEYVYDSTVKHVVEFPIAQLETFESLRDEKRKYLLSYEGEQVGGPVIDYRDDIDVYLVKKASEAPNSNWDGVYYHRNQDDALRHVTHRDYAITVPYLEAYRNSNAAWTQLDQLTIRMYIRESGYDRPLVFETNRIHELYKLTYAQRKMAMMGIDSSVPVWKAEHLESSAYALIMEAPYGQITNQLVQDAYGYNALSKVLGDGPLKVQSENGRRYVQLPYGLQFGATMYEYNAQGELLGFYYYAGGSTYPPYHAQTTLVEGVMGRGGYKINTVFDAEGTILKPGVNYRYYIAPVTSEGVVHSAWQDVTDQPERYTVVNGRVFWSVDRQFWATAVKGDDEFLAYDLMLSPHNGLLRFSIDGDATYPTGSAQGIMFIPVGKLELWMNRRRLIEGLDYIVTWPQVIIVNKHYLTSDAEQRITVRATGFCHADMTRDTAGDFGYVRHGVLSRNNRFDLMDDKVLSITVKGRTYHRDQLRFSESDAGIYITDQLNGSPYLIDDVIVPLRELVDGETTYSLREQAVEIDEAVADYLSARLPDPVLPPNNPIPEKYTLYSPFTSTLMFDMINGVFDIAPYRGQYSDQQVYDALEGYRHLLDYEPSRMAMDFDVVSVHAHGRVTPQRLNIYQHNFLQRAVKVYLDNKIDLTPFIEIDYS